MGITLTFPQGGALVCGGSGRIGAGIVRQLAKGGMSVVFTYKSRKERALALEAELRAQGGDVHAQFMEAEDDASVQAAIDKVIAVAGSMHCLANAGGPSVILRDMADFTAEELQAFLLADALGIFRVVQKSIPHLRKNGGTITICTTMAMRRYIKFDGISPYSKSTVEALVHQLAAEERKYNIRCNCVPIGWIADETAEDFRAMAESARQTRPNLAELVDQLRLMVDEPGKPEDVGNLFAFLASEQSRYITGQLITIDGGASI